MDTIPYALPQIEDEEIKEVIDTIHSNWLSKGPKTVEFEKQFKSYVQAEHAIGLNSCTAGLHLSQLAAGVGPGDEVITTPYTFVSSANTIIHSGAKPVFVDIDPVTMNIDVNQIESKITNKTKAIIPVHFAGYPCDMDPIMEIARKYNLTVIEDAAHAVHTQYKGKMIGSIGDFTCFSFYATKNLVTGEGGMITTHNEALADKIRVMSLHGMSKNAWNRYGDKGSWYYEVDYPGFKYNMTDIQAAFGIVQLSKLEQMQQTRERYAAVYNQAFSEIEGFIVPHHDDVNRHAWHLYVLRVKEQNFTIDRAEFIEKLKEKGIGTSVHFIPVPMQPYYKKLGYKVEDYPNALAAYEGAISLPLYPKMSEQQVQRVVDVVLEIAKTYKR
ncbi:DegT/DnrJ/EryC1/StrS family aminotransferase [Bacillus aquiflavi]|uniref:DegT/DnrJ/EryC1/StrS family aminotransferase n=1 Tax=Bacillus aquiflavi TaxID=2672567 RepID=A0A6B3W1J6_9BACI|nr:DegT/DnrJ/EryC1/StrS family aminotransferase [Bacillus aquiflavi]MBA4538048.1 DegT/DnrJ/EryC1/StrS family aminotransferase [Bacillus aquiflavi]NEY82347.1 DegT/DnrJ/EryC1/StrS family aminotransferase [Bacillus aquiflavi]UAC47871.1 DegT/DnrJ/EryC1/StrS family aminotransferase [Bacillus aquiflavi]